MCNSQIRPSINTPPPDMVEQAMAGGNFDCIAVLRFGSWAVHVHSVRGSFVENLAFLYKQDLSENMGLASPSLSMSEMPRLYFIPTGFCRQLEILMANEVSIQGSIPHDGYLVSDVTRGEPSQSMSLLLTEVIRTAIIQGPGAPQIYMLVNDDALDDPHRFRVHLSFVMNRILFDFHRLYIHAGAVRIGNRTSLFVGDRGAGKSTTCLRLGLAGGTVLSDDHVMLFRDSGRFLASGCESYARITEKTEAFLLKKSLRKELQEFAGVLKKEFTVAEYCDSQPFRDYPVDHVFFLSRGERFCVSPMPGQQAVLELIHKTKTSLRFKQAEEFGSYLNFFSEFVENAQVFDLTLTTNLQDLDQLASLLNQ